MERKLVSVIVPTYKRPLFLQRAINSILLQDYQNIEVLVIDDNNDGDQYRIETESVMRFYVNNEKIKYIKHNQNSNGSSARNTGIQNSKGDFLVFLDDDDYFLPGRIECAVNFLLNSTSDIGGCCVNYMKKYKKMIYKQSSYNCVTSDCSELLSGKIDYGAGSTLMLKREVVHEVIGYNTTYQRHQDWEFLIRILRKYKIVNIPDVGVVISADGIRNNPNTQLLVNMKNKIFNEFKDDIGKLPKSVQSHIYTYQRKEIIYSYLKECKYKMAYHYYKEINEYDNISILKELPYVILSCIMSVWPSFMICVYWMCSQKFKKYKAMIEQTENRYSTFTLF